MESDRIEKLLEKYFEASATASEEAMLRDYFDQVAVADHLAPYAPMFRYFSETKQERFVREVDFDGQARIMEPNSTRKPKGTRIAKKSRYAWMSVAAAVAVLIGVYVSNIGPSSSAIALEDEYTQAEIKTAQEALALLSINFTKGAGQLSHLGEFEKNTNRFLDGGHGESN